MVSYIPILTTLFTVYFTSILWNHYSSDHSKKYVLWWALGVFVYGAGTLTESLVTLFGWSPYFFRAWYITGAIYGGVMLAQGSAVLLFKPKAARITSILVIIVTVSASMFVLLSPLDLSKVEPHRLTGSVLVWKQLRYATPFINIYAFIVLVGGAIYSAIQYARKNMQGSRVKGNVLIAIGGLLPGIGGSFTKFGYTEVLYVCEFIGILFIFWGYKVIRNAKWESQATSQLREVHA
jgi:hypothetical protein